MSPRSAGNTSLALFIIISIVGGSLLIPGVVGCVRTLRTRHWSSAPGVITTFKADEPDHTKDGLQYSVRVYYDYVVNGQAYTGKGVTLNDSEQVDQLTYQEWQRKYASGTPVRVYYDPTDARQAVLEFSPGEAASTLLLVGGIWFLFGIGGVAYKLATTPKAKQRNNFVP